MPIISIIEQPDANALRAAYRPVVLKIRAQRTDGNAEPPVVYCDIYINGVFYKTICKTQWQTLNATDSDWYFDIQDACQEVLSKRIGSNGGADIIKANEVFVQVLCKFRSSGFDGNGFIQHEDDAPVQGTGKTSPVAGTGTDSNLFYVLNSTLQHQNNQDLAAHLDIFKTGTWSDAYPLTHRLANYKISKGQSDYYPIMYTGADELKAIKLFYRNKGQVGFNNLINNGVVIIGGGTYNPYNITYGVVDNGDGTQNVTFNFDPLPANAIALTLAYFNGVSWTQYTGGTPSPQGITIPLGAWDYRFTIQFTGGTSQTFYLTGGGISGTPAGVYLIPNGPKNLASLFPAVAWEDLQDYYIQVLDVNDVVVATSVINRLCSCGGDEAIRVHFLSYMGTYDAVNFIKPKIIHEDNHSEYQKALSYPLQKSDGGTERFNVKSNDTYEVRRKCLESEMIWLQECADSPKLFLEWAGTEGQSDDFIPVVKIAGKFEKLKNDREFDYDFVIQFKLSNEYLIIRN